MMVQRQWMGSLLAGAILAVAATALALPKTRLVYVRGEGAEGCPEAMELRLAVLHRLGYSPFDPNAKESIVLFIRREDDRLKAGVDLIDEQGLSRGSRFLDAPAKSCDELIAAAALSISLAIDPERAMANAPSPTPKRAPPMPPTPSEPESPLPEASPQIEAPVIAAAKPIRPELVVSLHGESGALVAPTLGTTLGLGLRRGAVSLSLEGRVDLPVSIPVGRQGSLTTWLLSGNLVPCVRGTALRFCGVAGYGRLSASTSAVTYPRSDHAWYGTLGFRLGTEVPVSRNLRLGVHVDMLASLATYQADLGSNAVWTSNRLSGLFGLDGAWVIQ
jgi:hypothetical protein